MLVGSPERRSSVGYAEPHPHHWGRILPVFLILVLLAIAWYAFQTSTPTRRQLTEDEIVATLLDQMRQSHGEEISVEIPALWVRVENSMPVANINNRFQPKALCSTQEGDKAVFVKAEQGRLLLRYRTLYRIGGMACPDGTLFSISAEKAATN
jgi:hypothetical protein